MTMTLVSTATVASDGSTIEFTSIPQTGTDLLIFVSGRSGTAAISSQVSLTVNGLTSSIYTNRRLYGDGSSVSSSDDGTGGALYVYGLTGNSATTNMFGNLAICISNYTSSTAKYVDTEGVGEHLGSQARQSLEGGLINTTAAITSILLDPPSGFKIGSTASLYTITKGSGGATVS